MAALTKSRSQHPASFYPLLVLTLLGIGLAIYRLVVGLGPTTNLNDHYPWGLWITIDLFLIPVAGAAFTISLISYFLGREDYHSVIRPAVLAGFLGYGVVGILLFMDIGRWNQFYNIFVPGFINLHSFLEEISLCVTLYTGILALEIAPVFLEKWGYKTPIRWIERGIFITAGAGIVLSMLHQSSLGSLFLWSVSPASSWRPFSGSPSRSRCEDASTGSASGAPRRSLAPSCARWRGSRASG